MPLSYMSLPPSTIEVWPWAMPEMVCRSQTKSEAAVEKQALDGTRHPLTTEFINPRTVSSELRPAAGGVAHITKNRSDAVPVMPPPVVMLS